jgi:tRNA(Arg) A34 adenosine deaminase TadA
VLVDGDGRVRFEDTNHVAGGDATQHPEFAIARWAATHLTPDERAAATVYTSGEHCPMCAAAHAWVGLGRIVYASSSAQLRAWRAELGAPPSPVAPLPVPEVAPGVPVEGPVAGLDEEVHELHRRRFGWRPDGDPPVGAARGRSAGGPDGMVPAHHRPRHRHDG